MVSHAKIGTSAIQTRATAGVANATYIFCLPGSPAPAATPGTRFLVHQLDYRYRPRNFVEIMPRLDEHLRRPTRARQFDRLATPAPQSFALTTRRQAFVRITRTASGEARNCNSALAASGLALVPTAPGNTV